MYNSLCASGQFVRERRSASSRDCNEVCKAEGAADPTGHNACASLLPLRSVHSASHGVHSREPGSEAYVPIGHSSHAAQRDEPAERAKVPRGHGTHTVAPATEESQPAGHGTQTVEVTVVIVVTKAPSSFSSSLLLL